MTNLKCIWMVHDKLEENLDRLLQVGGGFGSSTSSRRRTNQHLSNGSHPRRILRLYQQRHTFTKRLPRPDDNSIMVGQARALEGHESSKLPGSAHPFSTLLLVGRARASEGHESSKLHGSANLSLPTTRLGEPGHRKGTSPPSYPAQPTLLRV
jgi:hypothetical protein